MTAIIDTSSLLALVRYYLPFDRTKKLKTLIQNCYEGGQLIIIDKVVAESRYIAKGIILKELEFINGAPKHIIKTDGILPSRAFFNCLENQFCNKDILTLKDYTNAEFESEKTRFLNSADAKIILHALGIKSNGPLIVTEETSKGNDNKIFKKIPNICSVIGLNCCTLPSLLKDHLCINLDEFLN